MSCHTRWQYRWDVDGSIVDRWHHTPVEMPTSLPNVERFLSPRQLSAFAHSLLFRLSQLDKMPERVKMTHECLSA